MVGRIVLMDLWLCRELLVNAEKHICFTRFYKCFFFIDFLGDISHRPFVSGEPDILSIPLSGEEDFIILGCDGLWDFVTEDDVAYSVYKQVRENPGEFRLFYLSC